MQQVDFYLVSNLVGDGQLKLTSRLSNKIQRLDQHALIVTETTTQLEKLEALMWTFSDTSFVAHDRLDDLDRDTEASAPRAKIYLSSVNNPKIADHHAQFDVLINLSSTVPASLVNYKRIAEIVDADENAKVIGREKFKHYRNAGVEATVHNIQL